MALNATNFEFALKEMYPDDAVRDMVYEDNPLLAMVDKEEDPSRVGVELIKVPIIIGNPQGRSALIATAITNAGNTTGKAFLLTLASDYAIALIDRRTLIGSMAAEAAFVDAEIEIDGAINAASRSLAKAMYRDGNGQLGQITSVTSADPMVITLKDINDISNFEVGMILEADDTAAGSSLRATPATATIDGLDRDAGTITTNYDNSGAGTDWAADDYLFQDGDEAAMIKGLDAWLPTSAPGATAFFGVDRTADVTRLGGVRVTGTGMGVHEALHKLAAKISREKGKPRWAFINDVQYNEAINALGGKVEYVKQGVSANVYFSGITIHGPKGPIEVYPDYNCPSQRGYVLTPDALKLYSLNAAPHIFDDGNDQKLLRQSTADAYEARVGYYAQLGFNAPGYCGVATLDAATFA